MEMESYSNPDIPDILQVEGNSVCADCGAEKPKWASMNNGVFLCLKCAGIHRSFGMSISLIRSLQIDSWTDNQLLFLTKGGNKNFKKNLTEFNIDPSTTNLDLKYKSKAADYYRRYLKNEVDRESDSNYVPTQIMKPELNIAQEIIETEEEKKEVNQNEEKVEEQKPKNKFFGFMSSVFTKVKEGTSSAAKNVEKGLTDLKLGEKIKVAGSAIADAAVTSGHFIADKTQQAVNSEFVQNISKKTKEGVNSLVTRTKSIINKDNKPEENKTEAEAKKDEEKKEENAEEKKEENTEEKKEENTEEKKEENTEEKKEENAEEKKEEKEEGKKEEDNSAKENNLLGNNAASEEKVEAAPEQNLDTNQEEGSQNP